MKRFVRLSILALFVSLLPAVTVSAAADAWLDEGFGNGVSGVFDSGLAPLPTSNGHNGNGVVSKIPSGNHWGSAAHWNTNSNIGFEPDDVWYRYWLQFPSGFKISEPGKLPGVAGLYSGDCRGLRPSRSSDPCWSARMMMSPLYAHDGLPSYPYNPNTVTRIGFYAYLLNNSDVGQVGDNLPWDPDLATLNHGQWYCIEGRAKMNTPGVSNGHLQGYVDGQQAFNKNDVRFRGAGHGELHVKSFWFDVYHGGASTSPRNNEILFDSLAVGPEQIGCDDGPPEYNGTFRDDDNSVFEASIEQLAAAGITVGCNPPHNDKFCPDNSVSRGQMSAFLKRALEDDYTVDLAEAPLPPTYVGFRSHLPYRDALDLFQNEGASTDTFVVSYPIDQTSGDKDWLKTGQIKNPNIWVPVQLETIWQRGRTPHIEVTVNNLSGLANGNYDNRVNNMLNAYKAFTSQGGGRRVILDILPDANLDKNSYGDNPGGYKTAFRGISDKAHQKMGNNVRVLFSQARLMDSKYSPWTYGLGGFTLWWPGASYVDMAAVTGRSSNSNDSASTYFSSAINEMASVIGPDIPIILSRTGAPTSGAKTPFADSLEAFVATHPQLIGFSWEDRDTSGPDTRVSNAGGTSVNAGFVAASQAASTGGLDWLFSSAADDWAAARRIAVPFDDIAGTTFENSIRWLAATGITKGCAGREFCPDQLVSRGQMAAFLSRALNLPVPTEQITFSDTNGHIFEASIAKLAFADITKGCNPPSNTRFCPNSQVTRAQMAAFMVRAGLAD